MITSSLLTLVVVPVVYCYMDDLARWALARWDAATAPLGHLKFGVCPDPHSHWRPSMNLPLNTSANTSDPVAQARYNMIEQQIRPWNVLDADVLELLSVVRREDFVPAAYRSLAFADIEVPLLGNDAEEAVRQGHSMLQPRVEARILQDLRVQPTDRVLEIGAGSGYMAPCWPTGPSAWCPSKSTPHWPAWPVKTCATLASRTPKCARVTVPVMPCQTAPSM